MHYRDLQAGDVIIYDQNPELELRFRVSNEKGVVFSGLPETYRVFVNSIDSEGFITGWSLRPKV